MTKNNRYSKEEVIDKIKKLLALSGSSNEHESQAALLHAQRWMARYNISMNDVETEDDRSEEVIHGFGTTAERRVWWKGRLANIIADNFKCYMYLSTHGGGKVSIRFLGNSDDVEIAIEVFQHASKLVDHYAKKYVRGRKKELEKEAGIDFKKDFDSVDEIETWAVEEQELLSWNEFERLKSRYDNPRIYKMRLIMAIKDNMGLTIDSAGLKNDFISGFLEGLSAKFKEQMESNQSDWGLVLTKSKEVEDEFESMNFGKGRSSKVSRSGDKKAIIAGFDKGNSYGGTPKANIQG